MGSLPPRQSTRSLQRFLFPLGSSLILSLFGDQMLYAVLPLHLASLQHVGIFLSANRLVRLVANPIVGRFLDRLPRKPLLLAGLGFGAVSTLTYLVPESTIVFLAGRIVWGICFALIYLTMYRMVLDITPQSAHGTSSGSLQAYLFGGLALTPLIGGLVNDWLGYSWTVILCSTLGAIGFFLAAGLVSETRPRFLEGSAVSRINAVHWLDAIRSIPFPIWSVNTIILVTHILGDGVFMATISLFLQNEFTSGYGDDIRILVPAATAGGVALAVRSLFAALTAPLAGRLSDWLHDRWWVVLIGIVTGTVGMITIAAARSGWGLLLGILLLAFNAGAVMAVAPAIISRASPASQVGMMIGLFNTFADIGLSIAPITAYSLAAILPLRSIYALTGGLMLLTLPFSILQIARKKS